MRHHVLTKLLCVLLAAASGCYTNSAVVKQRLSTNAHAQGATMFVSFRNQSDQSLDVEPLLRTRLESKGYRVVPDAEGAEYQLDVVVSEAAWTADPGSPGGGGGGAVTLGGGGGGKGDAAVLVLLAVVIVAVIAVEATRPREWLLGTVDLTLKQKSDPVPQTGSIALKFSCVSDRPGTLRSARQEVVDRIAEMFE